MFVQTFALVLPFAWRTRAEEATRLGLVWFVAAMLPFLAGHEPRYYAPALLPFAIITAAGFRVAGELLFGSRGRVGWMMLFAGLVLFKRYVLAPLMPFEVEQSRLFTLFETLHARHPGGSFLIP
jgi:hypothetical protein